MRLIDDPNATLASLAGREIPGCYSEYSDIVRELCVRPDSEFGQFLPTITLSRKEEHPPDQRWSAFVREFNCGWYGPTPRAALATLYDQWWNGSGRALALRRIEMMDILVDKL